METLGALHSDGPLGGAVCSELERGGLELFAFSESRSVPDVKASASKLEMYIGLKKTLVTGRPYLAILCVKGRKAPSP